MNRFLVNKSLQLKFGQNPASIYLVKIITKNTRKRCEICSKFVIKTGFNM